MFSFIFARDARADRYRSALEGSIPALSFQTVAEALQGAYQRNWGAQRLALLRAEMQRYAIIPFDMGMAEQFARLRAARRREGREIDVADAWVAATALWAQCPVVTHNIRDFEGITGLEVVTERD